MTAEFNPTDMTLDSALVELSEADYDAPMDALRWLIATWPENGPILIDRLRAFTSGKDRSRETTYSLIYTTYLMAGQRDTAAFGPLCDFATLHEDLIDETMGGDWITAVLPSMLTSTFDGDTKRLHDLIENRKADEFAANSALEVLHYHTAEGRIGRTETSAYLGALFDRKQFPHEHFAWVSWGIAVGCLGLEEHRERMRLAIDGGYIMEGELTHADFERDLAQGQASDTGIYPDPHHVAPIDDAVAAISSWYGFSENRRKDEQAEAMRKLAGERQPAMPDRPGGKKVGRNEPCPCGSGKKYKKCCLQ